MCHSISLSLSSPSADADLQSAKWKKSDQGYSLRTGQGANWPAVQEMFWSGLAIWVAKKLFLERSSILIHVVLSACEKWFSCPLTENLNKIQGSCSWLINYNVWLFFRSSTTKRTSPGNQQEADASIWIFLSKVFCEISRTNVVCHQVSMST